MQSVFDLKSGPYEPHIDLQIAAYWELIRNGKTEGLVFDEATHTGTVAGESLLSVTTILRRAELTPDFYKWLDPWYLTRGTYVHLASELYDKGLLDEDTVDEAIRPYLEAYKVFRRDFQAQVTGIEVRLYHPTLKYFGIIDRIMTGSTCYSLHLKPGKRVPYKLEEVTNIRSHLNIFISALNIVRWREMNIKEAAHGNSNQS